MKSPVIATVRVLPPFSWEAGRAAARKIAPAMLLAAVFVAGCGSGAAPSAASPASSTAAAPASTGPQNYFESAVEGPVSGGTVGVTQQLAAFSLDDTQQTFSQTTFGFGDEQSGPQLNYSGSFSKLPRGLLDLKTDFYYGTDYGINFCDQADCDNYPGTGSTPATGGYAVELAGQAGALVELDGLPFTPLAAATACPASSSPLTYQFVTIPAAISQSSPDSSFEWNPDLDTAYGSVDVSALDGSIVFSNILQYTASGTQIVNYAAITGTPVAYTSIEGACSSTFYGSTISVPGSVPITSTSTTETQGPVATVGIGPSNLLVESNGSVQAVHQSAQGASFSSGFQPFLGAGTGAMGLPKPSSPIGVSDLTGAQYLGFIYNSGTAPTKSSGWTSTLGSFGGFPSPLPPSCAANMVADTTGTQSNPLFGGDFPNNDATTTGDAGVATFGNCDVSIYLNAQDSKNNGLFPNASVTLGTNFSGNGTGNFSNSTGVAAPVTFPAVAIAGQLGGKFAIFLVSSTGEGIYLFQSN